MKKFKHYINEWKYSGSNVTAYTVHPTTKRDLQDIIAERLDKNIEEPFLLDIDTSRISTESYFNNRFTDLFSAWRGCFLMNDCNIDPAEIKVIDISSWHIPTIVSLHNMFYLCKGLEKVDISGFHTARKVENISGMFYHCESLKEIIGIEKLYTRNVKSQQYLFEGCKNLRNIDVNNWDTTNMKRLSGMFKDCDDSIIPKWYNKIIWDNAA